MHAGDNTVEIRVVNLWVNCPIGHAQPQANKVSFITIHPYKADSALVPSGSSVPSASPP